MNSDDFSPSRRTILHGAAATLAAGMVAPAFAQTSAGSSAAAGSASTKAPQPMRNPQKMYAQPPFDPERQPWPGLAQKMDPRPDHGEESYQGSGRLQGRKALITGGDSGIGRAAAIAYAREGADVAFGYLEDEEPDAQDVIKLIEDAGRKAVALPGDIRDEKFCQEMIKRAVEELGGLDILVINAARQQSNDSIMDISTDQFDWTVKTNLYAMFWLSKAAIPHLPEGSSIINTSSVVAYDPPENLLDYSMTKAAIVNFTKCLAKQMIGKGIRVNTVAPGPFWTPLQVSGGQTMDNLKTFGEQTPLGRPGQPVEIAPLYVQLASTEASYVTGEMFAASGGMLPY
ncbi:SDR family oxidoreductase [Halopseudomonas nanhaiensis]|uniref:SDR family oxidoreductase n=1 Tax=Halopseudomonas nanhaiensis TaxID=2830842 RepID=UPI002435F2C8|nr:SDR family oxidoreductase [Halopseudomonas nanhaiensis]UAW98376.1 SDR family oxidoreductase [Halopseudomonas nanhaiensis]